MTDHQTEQNKAKERDLFTLFQNVGQVNNQPQLTMPDQDAQMQLQQAMIQAALLQQYQESMNVMAQMMQRTSPTPPNNEHFAQQLLLMQYLLQQNQFNAQFMQTQEVNHQPQQETVINKKIQKKCVKKSSKYNSGHWSTDEHSLYLQFLQTNQQVMSSSEQKKANKIFKQMSDMVNTRSPSQCRSHHQKFNPMTTGNQSKGEQRQSMNEK